MKNQFSLSNLLILCVILVTFSACDEEDTIVIDVANLTGETWTYSETEADNELVKVIGSLYPSEFTFNEDNTYEGVQLGFETSGTYNVEGETLTLDPGDEFEREHIFKELSPETMKLYTVETDSSGNEIEFTLIYTR